MQHLPDSFRTALRKKDFDALLRASEAQADKDADDTALALWQIARQIDGAEALQVLSYSIVRNLTGPIAEACRLWLLLQSTDDISTSINILSGLGVLVVEHKGIPDYQMAVLADFLSRCLDSSASAVRISVLDFLRDHAAARGWPRRIGRTAARKLAKKLEHQLAGVAVEEEVAELASVVAGLRSDVIPPKPTINLAPINALVAELEKNPAAADLARFTRLRRLHEHAQKQAQHDDRPVLTVRISTKKSEPFLSRVREVFDLCRLENVDPTNDVWREAPAASLAKLLRAQSVTTKETFERFRLASEIAEQTIDATAGLADLHPRQADAIAQMLLEAGRSGVEAEFMLTFPEISAPQLVLPFSGAEASKASWRSAAEAAHRAAKERPEVYSEEIPQANTVGQVLQAVDAILARGEVDVGDIDNIHSARQINYYTHAARVLGFLDAENNPTSLGRTLEGRSIKERFAVAASAFNQSVVAQAWRAWAKKEHLATVDPLTAEAFLHDRAVGVSGSTIPRRASTLRGWQSELLPHYRSK